MKKNMKALIVDTIEKVIAMMLENKFEISNIDSTVCLQSPKLKDYIQEMKLVLAKCMQIDLSQISIKATTTEKLGFVGRKKVFLAMLLLC